MEQVAQSPASRIGPFLAGPAHLRPAGPAKRVVRAGRHHRAPQAIHTVKPLEVRDSQGAADCGDRRVRFRQDHAGAGKPDPGLDAAIHGQALPEHVRSVRPGIAQVKLIDATPIGINVRSTVATYANVHDELRKICRPPGCQAGRL